MATLLLVAAVCTARAAPGRAQEFDNDYARAQQKWPPARDRLKAVDAWFRGGPAPRFWRIRKGALEGSRWGVPPAALLDSTRIAGHWQKEVNASSFNGIPVVVKATNALHTRHGQALRSRAAVLFEILYLVVLRGEPGVPALYGGWRTHSGWAWVVQHGGSIVGRGKDRIRKRSVLKRRLRDGVQREAATCSPGVV